MLKVCMQGIVGGNRSTVPCIMIPGNRRERRLFILPGRSVPPYERQGKFEREE